MAGSNKRTMTVRWETRRKLAIRAFWAFLAYTLFYWVAIPYIFTYYNIIQSTVLLTIVQESYSWFAITMMGVILGYMGFTTLPFVGKGKVGQMGSDDKDEAEAQGEYVDPNYKFKNEDL